MRTWIGVTGLAVVAALTFAAASSGRSGADDGIVRVAVVTDGRGDADALDGLSAAKRQLGVDGRGFVARSPSDRLRVLSAAAEQGYGLVIAGTPAMASALAVAAVRYPRTRFAIVGVTWSSIKTRPTNVRGLVFAAQEAGYLAGAAAALASRTHTVGAIGELRDASSVAFLAGFKAGARRTVGGTKVQVDFARAAAGAAGCRTIALRLIASGSDGIAGPTHDCAVGALRAAAGKGAWGIAVGNEQSFRGRHVLTSVLQHVDVAVYATVEDMAGGSFHGGEDALFTIGNGAIGLGSVSPRAPSTLTARLTSIAAAIREGKVDPPRT